ncbi:protein kinase domain-containing protein [Aquihabitans sp. McL0605]|uniref:protein kinase domain-containing protein n=1 Tax=Aquihabitans sp. McL0605 TaxID=3415671 RepID=UPI003CF8CD81
MISEDTVDEVPPSIPPLAGRWQIGERLGGGGEGIVYAAEPIDGANGRAGSHAAAGARVAVKITWSRTGESELNALLKLQHRHLATYRDFGFLSSDLWRDLGLHRPPEPGEDLIWIVMPRASGSLADQIDERAGSASRPIGAASAVRLWHQLSDALTYLEEQQVVHGDIKPANVLVYDTDHGTDWRLADFGMSAEVSAGLSRTAVAGATRTYSSPGVLSTGRASVADDRYSAALTVHLAATGVLPFTSGGRVRIRRALPRKIRLPVSDAITACIPDAPSLSRRRRRRRVTALAGAFVFALFAAAALRPGLRSEGGKQAATTTLAPKSVASSSTTEARDPVVTTDPPVTEVGPAPGSGSSLYFIPTSAGGSGVYRLDLATNEATKVETGTAPLSDLSVSRSGRYVGTTTTDGGDSLVVGDVGSDRSRIYDVPGNASEPSLSPDGTLVAFVSDATGDLDVMALDLSTEEVVTIAGNSWDERDPVWEEKEVTGGPVTRLHYVSSAPTDVGGHDADGIQYLNLDGEPNLHDLPAPWSIDLTALPGLEDQTVRVRSMAVRPSRDGFYSDYVLIIETSSGSSDVAVLTPGNEEEGKVEYTSEDEVAVAWCPEGIVTATRGDGLVLVPANGKKPQRLSAGADVRSLSCIGAAGDQGGVDDGAGTVVTSPDATTTTLGPSGSDWSDDGGYTATTAPPTTTIGGIPPVAPTTAPPTTTPPR